MNKLIAISLFFVSFYAQAVCFRFEGKGPGEVGPVKLFKAAEEVCVSSVNGFSGHYYSVEFSDSEGKLGQWASHVETLMRCPGFCREYVLTTGNANGRNVSAENTRVTFHAEGNGSEGTVRIAGPRGSAKVYTITKE